MAIDRRSSRVGYLPALDGFRGLAVAAVLLFHGGVSWAVGGYLGVTAFFVLSGFLITSLLLIEREATGRIDLRAFWGRRARRLAPGALLLLGLVVVLTAADPQHVSHRIIGDGVAAALWVANWRFVFTHASYADLFSSPSPFAHMWSLAVEEQFYLVLPLAAAVLLARRRRPFTLAVLAGIAASTAAAFLLHAPHSGPGRAYYGTDARVAEPLVGVLLALMLVGRHGLRRAGRRGRVALDLLALGGLAGLGLLVVVLNDGSDALYRGGFLLTAALSAVVIAAATQRTVVARALGAPPLVLLGRISYGVYLFHWPVFLWLSPGRTGLPVWPLFALRSAVTLALAAASYALVERPIRLGRIPRRAAVIGWANATVGGLAALIAVVSAAPAGPTSLLAAGNEPLTPPPVIGLSRSDGAAFADATTTTAAMNAAQGRAAPSAKTASAATAPALAADAPSSSATITTSEPRHGSSTSTSSPASSPPPTSTSTPTTPKLRVAVVGDSMGNGLGKGMVAWAQGRPDVVVYNLSLVGCPISRGGKRRIADDNDWPVASGCGAWSDPASSYAQDFSSFNPDVVVMEDGMNEVPDRYQDAWGEYRSPGDPRFDQWLLGEYNAAINVFARNGAVIIALNTPCADWAKMAWKGYSAAKGSQRTSDVNNVSTTLWAQGVRTGDLMNHLCPNGQFTETVDGVADARPDGYHLSDAAAEAVASVWLGPMVLQVPPGTARQN